MSKKIGAIARYEIIMTSHSNEKFSMQFYVGLDSCKKSNYITKILTEQCLVRINPHGVCFKHKKHNFEFIPREKGNTYVMPHLQSRWLLCCGNNHKAAKWIIKQARLLEEQENS